MTIKKYQINYIIRKSEITLMSMFIYAHTSDL